MKHLFLCFAIMIFGIPLTKGDVELPIITLIQRIVDGGLHVKLAEVGGIKDVVAPSYGYSDPIIPDVLYRVKLRIGFASDLGERLVIENLTSFVLREYFSSKSIKILACESFFPGSRVSILYSEGDHLGEMTLFLMRKERSYELLVNLHMQIHPDLAKNRLIGIQVESLLLPRASGPVPNNRGQSRFEWVNSSNMDNS